MMTTLRKIQSRSVELGLDKMSKEGINAEIAAARRRRSD